MSTFGDLKNEVLSLLQGYTTDVPMVGTLVGPVGADSGELALDFGDSPGAARPNGLVEIGDELLYVSQYNPANGVAIVPAWGRGYWGTTAAAHDAGEPVTVRPRYPRKRVGDALNSVLADACPPLFAPRDLAPINTGAYVGLGFPLPEDTIRVLRVDATEQLVSPQLADRFVLNDWSVRNVAGQQLLEIDRCQVYRTLQVTIAAEPGRMLTDADEFTAVTGLPASCTSLAVFGAVARLILGAELPRQQATTVEAAARGDRTQAGSATTISRYFMGLYQTRLEAEQDRLLAMYPLTLLRRG